MRSPDHRASRFIIYDRIGWEGAPITPTLNGANSPTCEPATAATAARTRRFVKSFVLHKPQPPAPHHGAAFSRAERAAPQKHPKIENARDRSLWRFNLDHSQYSRCCVLRLPQWPPSSFRWRCYPWLRWLSELRLASAPCTPARPVANLPARIGFVSSARPAANLRLASAVPLFRSSFGDPSGLRLTILVSPGLRPAIPIRPACAVRTLLRLGRQPTSDSHRCRPLARLAASSGLRLLLPLPSGWLRLRFAPAASPSVLTGREPLGLRLVAPSPAEPLMHS
jgi:hypothetical protein